MIDPTTYQLRCELCQEWSRSTIKRQPTGRYLCDPCDKKENGRQAGAIGEDQTGLPVAKG